MINYVVHFVCRKRKVVSEGVVVKESTTLGELRNLRELQEMRDMEYYDEFHVLQVKEPVET